MAQTIKTGIAVVFLSLLLLPSTTHAQMFGLGLTYGDKIQNVGGRLDVQYRFHQLFRVSGDFTAYLTKRFSNRSGKWNRWSVNSSLHFVFLEFGLFKYYALAGVNYANLLQTFDTGTTLMDSHIGTIVGGGIEKKLDFGTTFIEYRYSLTEEIFQQSEVNAGVRFYFGGK